MKAVRRRVAVITLGVVLLLSGTSWAGLIDIDIDIWLATISGLLQTIANERMFIQDTLQGNIKNLYKDIFPGTASGYDGIVGLFREIDQARRTFITVRDELGMMSCGWEFTDRTAALRDALLAPVHFCKPSFSVIYGAGAGYWDTDMEELHDGVSSFTLNTISESVEAEEGSWSRIFPDIEYDTEHIMTSPGWANREEAVGLAGADLMAQEQGKIAMTRLMREATDVEYERFEEKRERDLAMALLLGLSGRTLPDGGVQ